MLATFISFILIFAEGGGHGATSGGGESAFMHFWNTYLNYPGFEAWKFFNLAIFIYIMYRLLSKPLSEGFKAKREQIRAELIKAEEQRQAALARLTTTEARLAQLETETNNVIERASREGESERERILRETQEEIVKLRQQANSEIERLSKQAKKELRRFSAEESIRLAEARIRREMNPERDAQLVRTNIQAIGGLS